MTEQLNNILFWVSFVGICIFIINSIHSTIVLRMSKVKDFSLPDTLMSSVSLLMAVIFISLAITTSLRHTHPEYAKPTIVIPVTEQYEKVGTMNVYDTTTKKIDTVTVYKKVK